MCLLFRGTLLVYACLAECTLGAFEATEIKREGGLTQVPNSKAPQTATAVLSRTIKREPPWTLASALRSFRGRRGAVAPPLPEASAPVLTSPEALGFPIPI